MLNAMILNAPRTATDVTEQPAAQEWVTARAAWALIQHMVPFGQATFYRRIRDKALENEGVRIRRQAGSIILIDAISLLEWVRKQRSEE